MPRHSKSLINIIREENIEIFAEIGVLKSRNMRHILRSESAKIIKEYWAIDLWRKTVGGGRVQGSYTVERWHALYVYACKCSHHFKQLRVLRLTSLEAAQIFPDEYFDMVYIDANHSYAAVSEDIKAWLPKVKIGKILGGHDYNLRSVWMAVNDCLTGGVWEPPFETGRRDKNIARTKVWLKRRN